jgi:hypothetical protein
MNKVVARFSDGRTVKGMTVDFLPTKPGFHVTGPMAAPEHVAVEVRTNHLKALFFVKDLAGDPRRVDRREFDAEPRSAERRIRVTFTDGEVLVGTTPGYKPGRPGFFLDPLDPDSNIKHCYIVATSIQDVCFA